eukprot:GHRQ01023739.1.p4 GENE.GHRQ01023739.1~~GHRQ01023739.1.p4  ORF type:complete len:101 (-),score=38.06 GHRQ01023739.1:78-380(-)
MRLVPRRTGMLSEAVALLDASQHFWRFAVQVEISKTYGRTEWREDLKRLLRRTGCDAKHVMFLFSDSQIKDEAFVEDINNILNAGEVPNMFAADEKMQVG